MLCSLILVDSERSVPYPHPPAAHCQRLERFEEHRLSYASKSRQDHVFQNRALPEQAKKLFTLRMSPGQIWRVMASTWTKRV